MVPELTAQRHPAGALKRSSLLRSVAVAEARERRIGVRGLTRGLNVRNVDTGGKACADDPAAPTVTPRFVDRARHTRTAVADEPFVAKERLAKGVEDILRRIAQRIRGIGGNRRSKLVVADPIGPHDEARRASQG